MIKLTNISKPRPGPIILIAAIQVITHYNQVMHRLKSYKPIKKSAQTLSLK
jgi:hypothetical protein